MGVIKVSIYQKSIPDGLNLSIYKKLAALKSDFLIFPEYFYADTAVKDYGSLLDKSQYAMDWLQKLNDTYKGIILGGSVLRKEDSGKTRSSCPVITGGTIVDWYNKRSLSPEESALSVVPGNEPGIYILGGHRFAILLGDDIKNKDYLKELADMGIRLIFAMVASPKKDESAESKQERDLDIFAGPAAEYGLHIVKCGGTGTLVNQPLQGRSLVVAPSGISWRVAPHEEEMEIIKTVMLNVPA